MAAVTVLELAQILSALAGSAWSGAQLIDLIRKHAKEHPEDLEQLKINQPEMHAKVMNWLQAQDEMERESGA
jgi:hypothetical protein